MCIFRIRHAGIGLGVLLALALAACSQKSAAPESGAGMAPTASVAAATSAAMAHAASSAAAASSVATAPVAEVPVGQCGDQSGVPTDERIVNTAQWTTASEQDNFGYDVYRGMSKDGPFVKLTKQPIPGGGTTDETHHYTFVDDTIDPCKAYWYYVETIDTSGHHEKFTPTYKAKAKRRPAPTSGGA